MCTRANDACVEQYSQTNNCAQVKGAAKLMVTVVATQELQAGEILLRRFKAEVARDKPRRGNSNNRYLLGRCLENCVATHGILLTLVFFVPLGLAPIILAPIPKSHHSAIT